MSTPPILSAIVNLSFLIPFHDHFNKIKGLREESLWKQLVNLSKKVALDLLNKQYLDSRDAIMIELNSSKIKGGISTKGWASRKITRRH